MCTGYINVKKGHVGDGPFVPSREVVLYQRFSLMCVNAAKRSYTVAIRNPCNFFCSRQL